MGWGHGNLGGSDFNKSIIIVTAPSGSTVTASSGGKIKRAVEKNGKWTFKGIDPGTWVISAKQGIMSQNQNVYVDVLNVYRITIFYSDAPVFDYTGDFELVDDSDNKITNPSTYRGDWKLRLLTSGVLTVSNPGKSKYIDAFLVGGGGNGWTDKYSGGGGGGRTLTKKNIFLKTSPISVTIGSGGDPGGKTFFDTLSVSGGEAGRENHGGNGGSGGGDMSNRGGSDGSNGFGPHPGLGFDDTTREFWEPAGKLYAGGGGGNDSIGGAGGGGDGGEYSETNGTPNTGGGGGGSYKRSSRGASGIVVLRNARGV